MLLGAKGIAPSSDALCSERSVLVLGKMMFARFTGR